MAVLGRAILSIAADVSKVVSGTNIAIKHLNRISKTVERQRRQMRNYFNSFVGFYAVSKSIDFAKESMQSFLDTASKFEQFENRMSAFTTSLQEQKSEMARARDFALQYNQSIEKVTETMLLMKNYGLKDNNEALKTYANTALGAGKSVEQFAEAMADALTGENERLKEFGVKASLLGDKIGYQWVDSSGKTRNIIIENNKDIIDSTLRAIFNEKYAGQMEAYKNSWAGTVQGMKNSFTIFGLSVMNSGLFAYFKSLAKGISNYMQQAFANSSEGAEQFAKDGISVVNTLVKAFAWLAKVVAGVFNTIRIAYAGYLKLTGFLGRNLLKEDNINEIKSKISSLKDVLKNKDFGIFSNQNASIVRAKIRALEAQIAAQKGLDGKFSKIQEDGQKLLEQAVKSQTNINKFADKISQLSTNATKNIKHKIKEIKDIDKSVAKQKEAAKKALEALGAGYGNLPKQAKKAGKIAKKAHKDAAKAAKAHKKELEKLAKEAEKLRLQYADIFKSSLSSLLKGDFKGAFSGLFEGIGSKLLEPMLKNISNYLSTRLSSFTGSLGSFGSSFLGLGLSLIPSLLQGLFNSTVSEAEKKAAAGRVDFSDNSIKNLSNMFENVLNPHLKLTTDIRNATRNMDKNFYSIAKAIAGSSAIVDLTGQSYVPTQERGFLGFSSTSAQLLGTGTKLSGTLKNSSISGYISELVQESSFWGLFTDTYTREQSISIPSKTQQAIRNTFATGIKTILDSATKLGFNENYIKKQIENYKIKIGKINLKGLSEKEAADRLNSAFAEIFSSAIGSVDTLVKLTDEYAKQGEQRLATLSRIAVEYEQLKHAFDNINIRFKSQKNYLDVAQAFGSLTQFKDAYDAYVNNFYSVSERNKMLKRQLEKDFNNLGLTLPKTKNELKHLIETFKVTDKKTAETWKELLKISDTFAKVQDAAKEAREKEIQAAKEAREKEIQAAKEARDGVLAYLKKINDLYLGEYSPLKIAQKEIYAMQVANNSSYKNWEDNTKLALETKYKYATSEMDYRSAFNSYLQALKTNAPKATLDDVVEKLEKQEKIQEEQNSKFERQLQIALDSNKELQEIVYKLQQQIDLQRT